jgi:hypothetical protein
LPNQSPVFSRQSSVLNTANTANSKRFCIANGGNLNPCIFYHDPTGGFAQAQRKKRTNQSVGHHFDSENSADSSDSESFCDSAAAAVRKMAAAMAAIQTPCIFTTKAQRKKRKSHNSSIEQMSFKSSYKMV